jgi:iron complex transport system ATP-binding protein
LTTIRELAADGMAVLLTTHHPDHALLLNARVVAIVDGRVAATGSAYNVLQSEMLTRLYGASIDVISRDNVPAVCALRL